MAEQVALERKAQLAAKDEDEREQEARLETLRKSTRRRLGIGKDFFLSGECYKKVNYFGTLSTNFIDSKINVNSL